MSDIEIKSLVTETSLGIVRGKITACNMNGNA